MRSVLIYIIQEVEELREKVKAARSESISLRKSMDEFRCVNERNNNDVPGVVARLRVQVQQVQQEADEIRYDLMRIRVEKQSSEESHAQEIAELHKRLPELSDSKSRGINKQDEMRHKEECKGLQLSGKPGGHGRLQDVWYSCLWYTLGFLVSDPNQSFTIFCSGVRLHSLLDRHPIIMTTHIQRQLCKAT